MRTPYLGCTRTSRLRGGQARSRSFRGSAAPAGMQAATDLDQPWPVSWWRNIGKRLGILTELASTAEASEHLQQGVVFAASRIAVVEGRRYMQLADGRGWVPERSRKDVSRVVLEHVVDYKGESPIAMQGVGFNVKPTTVRYLRVSVLSTRSCATNSTQIAQISLRCKGKILNLSGFHVENPKGKSPPSEGPERLLTPKGKWLDLEYRFHGWSVLILTAPRDIDVEDIGFRTGSDQAARDPVHLRVDGSRDGWEWLTLHDTGEEFCTPIARKEWTPWLLLQPPMAALGDLGSPATAAGAEPLAVPATESKESPDAVSWWRNIGGNLGVLRDPGGCASGVPIQPGAVFAVVSLVTASGVRYLQLAGGRGWVPECSPDDQSQRLAEPVGRQAGPMVTRGCHMQQVANQRRVEVARECDSRQFASQQRVAEMPQQEHQRKLPRADHVGAPTQPKCPAGGKKASDMRRVRLRYLRMVVMTTRSDKATSTQIAQVSLRCGDKVLSLDGFTASNPKGQNPSNEGAERLLGATSKWLDSNFKSHGQSVLVLTAPRDMQIDDFAFCTPRDMEARDPVNFRIDGSRDGTRWAVLHESGENFPTPTARRAWTPWLRLWPKRLAPALWKTDDCGAGAVRFRCPVPGCADFAAKQGYLVEGKLLSHLLRKHPHAQATLDLGQARHERKRLRNAERVRHPDVSKVRGRFAQRVVRKRNRIAIEAGRALGLQGPAVAPSTPRDHSHKVLAKTKAHLSLLHVDSTPPPQIARRGSPIDGATPSPPPTKQRRMDVVTDPEQKTQPMAADPASDTSASDSSDSDSSDDPPPQPLLLSALDTAPAGSTVDVEAEVTSVSKIAEKQMLLEPPTMMQVRKFLLSEGAETRCWALGGKLATQYGPELRGLRVIVRGAKVRDYHGTHHLSGCVRVDVCPADSGQGHVQ